MKASNETIKLNSFFVYTSPNQTDIRYSNIDISLNAHYTHIKGVHFIFGWLTFSRST